MAKQQSTGERHWYAIHTYSGYENAVTRNLKQRIDSLNMHDKIFNVVVPTEKKIRVKGGKRVTEEERIYPGYVLVEMIVDDESWFVVRNTPRVTGFVGSGTQPVPLTEAEYNSLMKRMESDTVKHKVDLSVGDLVSIVDGPFKDLEGKVGEVDEENGKVKVMVSMFGRETPVELDFLQVKRV
ncbi:transcription termination/antitermination protein NusG [Candidatus Nomurabacteria bacterium]|nr:transcription termination/antitermination protein NusG [Candidatus Nomurabacteria bacterium]